jgi:hypothetical protein
MPFTWSEAQQRYRDTGTGRFVSSSAVRADIDRMLDDVAHRTGDLTRLLQDGRVGLRDWQTMMAQEIKDVHTANAVLARGGWENMTERDWGRVGHIIRDEYGHLRGWAVDLQTGRAPLDGRAVMRAEQYTQAGRGTFEEVKRYAARDAGLLWEYNVLEPTAAHCDGCLEADAMGVRPVGEIPAIGSRDCRANDRCELIQTADPPTGGLVSEGDGATDSEPEIVDSAAMTAFEDKIADAKVEKMGVFSPQGELLAQTTGHGYDVGIDNPEQNVKDNVIIHNHPPGVHMGGAPSLEDVRYHTEYDARQMRVVHRDSESKEVQVRELTRPASGWPPPDEVKAGLDRSFANLRDMGGDPYTAAFRDRQIHDWATSIGATYEAFSYGE